MAGNNNKVRKIYRLNFLPMSKSEYYSSYYSYYSDSEDDDGGKNDKKENSEELPNETSELKSENRNQDENKQKQDETTVNNEENNTTQNDHANTEQNTEQNLPKQARRISVSFADDVDVEPPKSPRYESKDDLDVWASNRENHKDPYKAPHPNKPDPEDLIPFLSAREHDSILKQTTPVEENPFLVEKPKANIDEIPKVQDIPQIEEIKIDNSVKNPDSENKHKAVAIKTPEPGTNLKSMPMNDSLANFFINENNSKKEEPTDHVSINSQESIIKNLSSELNESSQFENLKSSEKALKNAPQSTTNDWFEFQIPEIPQIDNSLYDNELETEFDLSKLLSEMKKA